MQRSLTQELRDSGLGPFRALAAARLPRPAGAILPVNLIAPNSASQTAFPVQSADTTTAGEIQPAALAALIAGFKPGRG